MSQPKAYLLQLGFALAGDAGHYHCAHFTLPDISFS